MLERPVALMRAQFAVVGMIDRDQRVDAGRLRRFQFGQMQPAFVLRQRVEEVAHQPDRRLVEIDDLDARHHAQQLGAGLDHALDAGMLVQRDLASAPGSSASAANRSKRVDKNSMNGVISNGRAPRTFSMVGSVVSVNCTWQLAHQEMTPVLPSASLSSELVAMRPDTSVSPVRTWMMPQQCVGPPMTL